MALGFANVTVFLVTWLVALHAVYVVGSMVKADCFVAYVVLHAVDWKAVMTVYGMHCVALT